MNFNTHSAYTSPGARKASAENNLRSSWKRQLAVWCGSFVLLTGCGASSNENKPRGIKQCGSGAPDGPLAHLRLNDKLPSPSKTLHKDERIEVDSSYRHQEMTFAVPSSKNSVCELSQHQNGDGSTEITYEVTRIGSFTFYSTLKKATEAFMPAMLGQVTVER